MSVRLDEAAEALADVLAASSKLGISLLNVFTGAARDVVPHRSASACRCGCHIPAPCWEPQPLGTHTSRGCPGSDATLRIRVTNCGSTARQVAFEPGAGSSGVEFEPGGLNLGPQESGYSVITFDIPPDATIGSSREFLVWIIGCKQYFLRWRVQVASRCGDVCPQLDVADCPDLIHHWYDHFYCEHPCQKHHH